ncbi:ComEC/Rec2 family competence protein, partial [Pseudomonas aeruginosa]
MHGAGVLEHSPLGRAQPRAIPQRQRLLAVDAQGRGAALAALVLGDGSGLSAAEWRMFQDTGTVHLMVISGSHISLLAGMLYGL